MKDKIEKIKEYKKNTPNPQINKIIKKITESCHGEKNITMKENRRKRLKSKGKTNSSAGKERVSTSGSRAGPDAFS